MGYFPFFIDIKCKKCAVIGGGKVALRKIEKLLPFEPDITVTAPEICPKIHTMPIKMNLREFEEKDLDGVFMAIAASGSRELNSRIYKICTEKNILINAVDDKENCGFIFPALVHKDDITIGISTGGTSPTFAKFLRLSAEKTLAGRYLETAKLLAEWRPEIQNLFKSEKARAEAAEAILNMCLINDKLPDDKEINRLMEELAKKCESE